MVFFFDAVKNSITKHNELEKKGIEDLLNDLEDYEYNHFFFGEFPSI